MRTGNADLDGNARMLKRRFTSCAATLAAAAMCWPAAAVAADPVIAAAGDIACDPGYTPVNSTTECHQQATSDLFAGGGFAAVLPLGDNQYEDATLAKYNAVFGPTWGRASSILHPVPGNHEYEYDATAGGYYGYFGASAGDSAKGYYSYNVGTWHLIALNSNCASIDAGGQADGCASGSPQELWLANDLAANANKCVLAYWHHPLFNSGHGIVNATNMTAIWQDLYGAHADVVLNGHAHSYERFALQDAAGTADSAGIREFVVGTGGKNHTSFDSTAANSQLRDNTSFGVLELTLHRTGYDWQFVHDSVGTFTDTGSQSCHTPAPPAAPAISSPADNSYENTGTVALSGTAEANTTITVYDGTTSKGTTTADGSGNWSKSLTSVADGAHTYTAKASDGGSNFSTASTAVHVTEDATQPTSSASSPVTSKSTGIAVSYNAADNGGGTGLSSVELWVKRPGDSSYSKAATDTTPASTGSFSYSAIAGDGSYSFYTVAVDVAGNREDVPASADSTTQLDTVAPAPPAITNHGDNSYENSDTFALSGTAEANATVTVYDGATSRGTTAADGAGTWSKSLSSVPDGSHTYTTTATDAAANTSSPSTAVAVTVDTGLPGSSASSPQSSSSTVLTVSYTATDNSGGSGLGSVELWVKRPGDTAYSMA
ncbi:MAG: hypothetical protein QOD76_876, partial [Solirubrobacteraceae bacterium]|nr:hypothetical protein [Solirubrobacteraceae bacterium]